MCVTVALLPTAAARAAGAQGGTWHGAGIIQATGGPYLTDALGRRLQLHGVNLVAKCGGGAAATPAVGTPASVQRVDLSRHSCSPRTPPTRAPLTLKDAETLARLGFNSVRLGIIWQGLEPGPRGVGPNDPRYCAPHTAGTGSPRSEPPTPLTPGSLTVPELA